jgi:hypothetical protein
MILRVGGDVPRVRAVLRLQMQSGERCGGLAGPVAACMLASISNAQWRAGESMW